MFDPYRFKTLPTYLTEANPYMKADELPGWETNNSRWITECVDYVQT